MPVADRQPLIRPQHRNEVWSTDFVFDRTADGRVLKRLTVVDDATTEAVAVVPARPFGGLPVTRVLAHLAITRGSLFFVRVRGSWKMTRLWKSANNADSHKPLGFAAFPTDPTAGTHHNQPISGQQRSTLRSGISCLKNGEPLTHCPQYLPPHRRSDQRLRDSTHSVDSTCVA